MIDRLWQVVLKHLLAYRIYDAMINFMKSTSVGRLDPRSSSDRSIGWDTGEVVSFCQVSGETESCGLDCFPFPFSGGCCVLTHSLTISRIDLIGHGISGAKNLPTSHDGTKLRMSQVPSHVTLPIFRGSMCFLETVQAYDEWCRSVSSQIYLFRGKI